MARAVQAMIVVHGKMGRSGPSKSFGMFPNLKVAERRLRNAGWERIGRRHSYYIYRDEMHPTFIKVTRRGNVRIADVVRRPDTLPIERLR